MITRIFKYGGDSIMEEKCKNCYKAICEQKKLKCSILGITVNKEDSCEVYKEELKDQNHFEPVLSL
jgi:hypothetical protein